MIRALSRHAKNRGLLCGLVVVMATLTGMVFGTFYPAAVYAMIKFQIYGSGCAKCIPLGQHAEAAAQALG